MGSVWVAHHGGLDTDVAVKFLLADLSLSEGALARFADEASVAAQIKSPHVVQVLDHGVAVGDLPFIVMELLEGEDLGVHVKRRGPLDLATAAALVQQLGQVLAKAHSAGIVHRDVKPENVFLLSGYGEPFVKLIDFGVAKWSTRSRALTATGTMVGTPDFMCPEQILNSKDVGPAADYWALVGVAYFALMGRPPFARETMPATILAIEKGEFTLPFVSHGIGSRALDAFFSRGLCRDPEGRFPSLSELIGTFCEAAEVPLTRTLRLVPGELHGVSPDSGATSGGPEPRTTRRDLPPEAERTRATRLGLAGSIGEPSADGAASGVATRVQTSPVEHALPQTLGGGTIVQGTIDTEPDTPDGLKRARGEQARRRAVLLLLGMAAAVASGWAIAKGTHRSAPHPETPLLSPNLPKFAPAERGVAEPPLPPPDGSLTAPSKLPAPPVVIDSTAKTPSASFAIAETEALPSATPASETNRSVTNSRKGSPPRAVNRGSGGSPSLKDRGF